MTRQIENFLLLKLKMLCIVLVPVIAVFTTYLFTSVGGAALIYSKAYAGTTLYSPVMPRMAGALGLIEPSAGEGGQANIGDASKQADIASDSEYQVQAVLVAKRSAVISGTMDGRLIRFPLKNGDVFAEGSLLAEYDCGVDQGRLKELKSRRRLSESNLNALKQLHEMHAASKIELVNATEAHEQNIALIDQINSRLTFCKIYAPFPGRVTNKMASVHEFVQIGRTLLDIASREQLQSEFLIPSKWLRWLNVGTPVDIFIEESNKHYAARIVRIHGEVDPVSQSVQVVAEMEKYHEELLPGMSGRAIFSTSAVAGRPDFGFLGMVLDAGGGGIKNP